MIEKDFIIQKTQEYLKYPSVVGYEHPFINKLIKDFTSLSLKTTYYRGLLEVKGDRPESNIVSVHIDRHGLIANGKGELEYAAYKAKITKNETEITRRKKMWEKISSRFNNEIVHAYEPTTGKNISSGKINTSYLCPERNNFIFYVEELSHLENNIPVSFSPHCLNELKSIEGQIDNVVNAALGFELFRSGFQGTLLLTQGEEIGESWKHINHYFLKKNLDTKRLFVLDTSPFEEDKSVDMNSVILRHKDNNADFDSELTRSLKEQCDNLKIPFLLKDEYLLDSKKSGNLGSTELGHLISKSKSIISGTTVQIATTGYHSNREKANYQAIENVFKLLTHTLN